MSFEIKLPLFEGPFDLLLFFIERNEIDIYDIPIAQITDEFLDYLRQMEEMNIELASEFILVAATLMKIKARMLLPRDEDGEGEGDPREELVSYLLEYKKYKSVLGALQEMEEKQLQRERRGNVLEELQLISAEKEVDFEMYHLDLYRLLQVYEKVINQAQERGKQTSHTVVPYPYTVNGQKQYLINKLKGRNRLSFQETMQAFQTKIAVIFNFLAILDLLQSRQILLHLEEGFNNFWIEANPEYQEPTPNP